MNHDMWIHRMTIFAILDNWIVVVLQMPVAPDSQCWFLIPRVCCLVAIRFVVGLASFSSIRQFPSVLGITDSSLSLSPAYPYWPESSLLWIPWRLVRIGIVWRRRRLRFLMRIRFETPLKTIFDSQPPLCWLVVAVIAAWQGRLRPQLHIALILLNWNRFVAWPCKTLTLLDTIHLKMHLYVYNSN